MNFVVTVVPLPSEPSAYVTGSTDQEPLGAASSITWGSPFPPGVASGFAEGLASPVVQHGIGKNAANRCRPC